MTVNDDDTAALVTVPGSLTISEDGSGRFTVKLATQPSQQVSVTVSSADTAAVSVPARDVDVHDRQLVHRARSVSVGGVDDADAVG